MRLLRNVLIIVVVVGGLAVAADLIAVRVAESNAGERIKSEYQLSREPGVDIHGFPFMTQVLGKEFEHVDIDISGIEAAGAAGRTLHITEAEASMHGVRVSGDAWNQAKAKSAEGDIRISYDDLSDALPLVKVGYGGEDAAGQNEVKATVGATFLGQRFEESLRGTITVVGGDTVRIRATGLDAAGMIPGLDEYVREQLNYEWRISALPDGLELKDIEVTEKGITITGDGKDVEFAESGSTS